MNKYIALFSLLSLALPGNAQVSDSLINMAQKRYPMLEVCEIPGFSEKVLCGTIEVYEDYYSQEGKMIPIEVVVLPSYNASNHATSAFTFHWGGNGGSAKNKMWYFSPGRSTENIRAMSDIVLIDDRGTGASNIRCESMDSLQPYSYAFVYDRDLIIDC